MAARIPLERIRNIGISAHIDSGKTTLTERILFYTGRIHKIHEVRGKDGVGAKMDSMDLEREKGITIQSAATYCVWNGSQEQLTPHNINIIDTPGHVDFTIEVERALRVLDGAILVLDSGKGVQSQSITVDRQMKRYRVPRIAFVNKMDNPGANYDRVAAMLKEKLGHHPVKLQVPMGEESAFKGIIDPIVGKAYFFDGDDGEKVRQEPIPAEYVKQTEQARHDIIHQVADVDDQLAEKFINEEPVSTEELREAIRRATLALKMTPVMCGSAIKNKGVQLLLDGVVHYLPNPTEVVNEAHDQTKEEQKIVIDSDPAKPFVGLAFKLTQDKYGQLTYFRVYQGRVTAGDTIYNASNEMRKVRVPRMFRMHSDDREEIESAEAGDIVAFYGVEASSGETFTDGKINVTLTSMHVPAAVISLAVAPKDRAAEANFSKALNRFTKEDPTFRVHQDEESQQTIISGMGELHLEIYMERMRREYNCEVVAGKPQVAYRESITRRADINYTHKKQTGGSGQYAKIMGYIEPLPADAVETYEFVDDVTGGSIPREFIPGLQRGCAQRGSDWVPGGRHSMRHQRRCVARSRLVRNGVQDGGADGIPRGLREVGAVDLGAHHEGRDRRSHRISGWRRRPSQPAPRRDSGDGRRGQRKRHLRGTAQHHVRILDGSPLGHARQRHLHHGVREIRDGAEARAGRDGQEVPREARRRRQEVERVVPRGA